MLNINTNELPEKQENDFSPFKAQVPVLIEQFQVDTNQQTGLQYLSLKAQVLDGEYKGRILWDDFNGLIDGTSEAWNNARNFNITEASGARIRTLLEAVGLPQLTDPSQLVNKTCVMDVYVNKKGYQAVSKYLAAGVQSTPQQAAPQANNPSANPGTASTPFDSSNAQPPANPFASS